MEFKLTTGGSLFLQGDDYQEQDNEVSSQGIGDPDQESGDVQVILTKEERGIVHAIQRMDPALKPKIDWKKTAEAAGLAVNYLKALCRLHISLNSYEVQQSSIERALISVSLDPIFESRCAQLKRAGLLE